MTIERQPVQTLADLLSQHWKTMMSDVHIGIPAAVKSYDGTKKKVSVQPLVKRTVYRLRAPQSWPVITDVPVLFSGSSNAVIQWPLVEGDTGMLLFADQSIDAWLSGNGSEVDPEDSSRFNTSDAVFVPGLGTFANPGKTGQGVGLEILYKGASFVLKDDGHIVVKNGTTDLKTLLEGLIDKIVSIVTVGGPASQVLNPASQTALNGYKTTIEELLSGS